jgi:hypothetical protein
VKFEEYADEFEDIEVAITPELLPVPGPKYESRSLSDRPLWPAPLLLGTLLLLLCMWLLSVLVLLGWDDEMWVPWWC